MTDLNWIDSDLQNQWHLNLDRKITLLKELEGKVTDSIEAGDESIPYAIQRDIPASWLVKPHRLTSVAASRTNT